MIEDDPTKPRIGNLDWNGNNNAAHTANGENKNVVKTGTTTVGITTDEGVVVATDRRASFGGRFVANKNVVKAEQIHPNAAMTLVGSVGGAQSFIDHVRAEASLYEARRGEDMSIEALATLAGNLCRGGPFFQIMPILGGVDEKGSHVYTIDPAGGVMQDEYTVSGSGMQLAYGHLEQAYHNDMTMDEAREAARGAIGSASERDAASGNGLILVNITTDGVEIEKYDELPEADEI